MDDRSKPTLSSDSIAEQFAGKMQQLERSAKEREVEARAKALGIGSINLAGFPISPDALGAIPRSQAEALRAVCFLYTGTDVRIGAIAPDDPNVSDLAYQLGERLHATARVYAISEESFRLALKRYDALPDVRPVTRDVVITGADLERFRHELADLTALNAKLRDASISDVIALVIAGAIRAQSSDIHIEAEERDIALRYRMDGVLHRVASIPKERWGQVASRLKLLAGLKINVSDAPQDGRFTIGLADAATMDVRVSVLPTAWGESVVLRLLMSSVAGLQFDQLGIRGRAAEQLRREIARPNGMIITTGPTGSGKTTTLYAVLNTLNDPKTKIITLEDPIEYRLAGIAQSQIDPAKEYTFAKGLRAILRQDPDIVMVGEIRDLETAEVAIQAALTGHLMLSTIHTNSASGAIPRFLSMDVKPFLLAPALNAVIGQRLVRKIHEACRADDVLAPEIRARVDAVIASLPEDERKALSTRFSPSRGEGELGGVGSSFTFVRGKGCDACHGTGYQGRIGIYEVFTMSKEIEAEILSEKTSEYRMQELAVAQGMVTMVQDGILKALDGITTADEVFRVAE